MSKQELQEILQTIGATALLLFVLFMFGAFPTSIQELSDRIGLSVMMATGMVVILLGVGALQVGIAALWEQFKK